MLRKISSTKIWLAIFAIIVIVQVYDAFGQNSEVVGNWKDGSVGAIGYQNQVTGAVKSGRSHIFQYKFNANGTYTFIGYMEMNMYNCSNTLFNQITGRYTVEGSTIYLDPARDYWKSTNSCAASANKERTQAPKKKSLEFQRTTDDYGQPVLCLTEGDARTCYQKDKQ